MADEQPLQNIILVQTLEEALAGVFLLPKRDVQKCWREIAFPHHYAHFFSLTHAVQLKDDKLGEGFCLLKQSRRSPYNTFGWMEQQLRTKWLGKAEETIDEEIAEINVVLQNLKRSSINTKFPSPLPGQ